MSKRRSYNFVWLFLSVLFLAIVLYGSYLLIRTYKPEILPSTLQKQILISRAKNLKKNLTEKEVTTLFQGFSYVESNQTDLLEITPCSPKEYRYQDIHTLWYRTLTDVHADDQPSQVYVAFINKKAICWEEQPQDTVFNSDDWKKSSRFRRAGMAKDLVDSKKLMGLSGNEVKTILGKPDEIINDSGELYYYYLELKKGLRIYIRFASVETVNVTDVEE